MPRFPLLAILVFGFALNAFDVHGQVLRDEIAAITANANPKLGTAWDANAETFNSSECLAGDSDEVGVTTAVFSFENTLSKARAYKSLGLQVGGRARFGAAEVTAHATFAKKSLATSYSVSAVWMSEYQTLAERLDVTNSSLTSKGQEAMGNPELFDARCGSSFVNEITKGGRLFFSLRVDFASLKEMQEFQAAVSFTSPLRQAALNLRTYSKNGSSNTRVEIAAYQYGGDPTQLTALFEENSYDGQSDPSEGVVAFSNCTEGEFDKCVDVVQLMLGYATNTQTGFPSQLSSGSTPGPRPISYRVAPYTDAIFPPSPWPFVETAAKNARNSLATDFEHNLELLQLANRWLNLSIGDRVRLQEVREVLELNIEEIVNVSKVCFQQPLNCVQAVANRSLTPIDQTVFVLPPRPTGNFRVYSSLEDGLLSRGESEQLLSHPAVSSSMDGEFTDETTIALTGSDLGSMGVAMLIDGQRTTEARLIFRNETLKTWNLPELPQNRRSGENPFLMLTTSSRDPASRDVNFEHERLTLMRGDDDQLMPSDGRGLTNAEGWYYLDVDDDFGRTTRLRVGFVDWREEAVSGSNTYSRYRVASRMGWQSGTPVRCELTNRAYAGDAVFKDFIPPTSGNPAIYWWEGYPETQQRPGTGAVLRIRNTGYKSGEPTQPPVRERLLLSGRVEIQNWYYQYANTNSIGNGFASVHMWDCPDQVVVSIPTPTAPAANTTVSPGPVAIEWAGSGQEVVLEVSKSSDFSELVLQQSTSESRLVATDLAPGGLYFWRVGVDGFWSEVQGFTVALNRPQVSGYLVELRVSDGSTDRVLFMGTDDNATSGNDAIDQVAPPPAPTGFDARLAGSGDEYFADIRADGGAMSWTMGFRPANGTSGIQLSWDSQSLENIGDIYLEDAFGGATFRVDMRSQDSFRPPTGTTAAVVRVEGAVEAQVSITSGWNLVGSPLDGAWPCSLQGALSGTCFGFVGQYSQGNPQGHIPGRGYWLRFPEAAQPKLSGRPVESLSVPLRTGWNLVSPPNCSVPLSDIDDAAGIVIAGTLFGYSGTYQASSELQPSRGYWLRSSADGTISMSCGTAGKAGHRNPVEGPEIAAAFVVSDASSSRGSLLLSSTQLTAGPYGYTVPPPSPGTTWHPSFKGGKYLTHRSGLLELTGAKLPVQIEVSSATTEGVLLQVLATDGSVLQESASGTTVSDPRASHVFLSLTSPEDIPSAFQISAPYPNPFSGEARIEVSLPSSEVVQVEVFDVLGRKLPGSSSSRPLEAGVHHLEISATKASSGVYFVTVTAGDRVSTARLVLRR